MFGSQGPKWYHYVAVIVVMGVFVVIHEGSKKPPKETRVTETIQPAPVPPKRQLANKKLNLASQAPIQKTQEVHTPVTEVKQSTEPCTGFELAGDGPEKLALQKEDWDRILTYFHQAKAELLVWLEKKNPPLPPSAMEGMKAQIRDLRIQRPTATEEPDLTWRGIGVWTLDQYGLPLIRVGNGLVKLALQQPARARFEITRLVAQSWAPCELARMKIQNPWSELLTCLGVQEKDACALGSNSEEGWAISSVLATQVTAPGCTLPVFQNESAKQCLRGASG